ncbi:hypothetical protein AVEN_82591-1, partial [Araneus ventricosus]
FQLQFYWQENWKSGPTSSFQSEGTVQVWERSNLRPVHVLFEHKLCQVAGDIEEEYKDSSGTKLTCSYNNDASATIDTKATKRISTTSYSFVNSNNNMFPEQLVASAIDDSASSQEQRVLLQLTD